MAAEARGGAVREQRQGVSLDQPSRADEAAAGQVPLKAFAEVRLYLTSESLFAFHKDLLYTNGDKR